MELLTFTYLVAVVGLLLTTGIIAAHRRELGQLFGFEWLGKSKAIGDAAISIGGHSSGGAVLAGTVSDAEFEEQLPSVEANLRDLRESFDKEMALLRELENMENMKPKVSIIVKTVETQKALVEKLSRTATDIVRKTA